MANRIVMRVEVSESSTENMQNVMDQFGLKHVATISHVIAWLAAQSHDIQIAVLQPTVSGNQSAAAIEFLKRTAAAKHG